MLNEEKIELMSSETYGWLFKEKVISFATLRLFQRQQNKNHKQIGDDCKHKKK
jgi:hypothetical protein